MDFGELTVQKWTNDPKVKAKLTIQWWDMVNWWFNKSIISWRLKSQTDEHQHLRKIYYKRLKYETSAQNKGQR